MTNVPAALLVLCGLLLPASAHAQGAGSLRGTVTLEHTDDAVPGAIVTVAGRSAATNTQGAFEIAGIRAGEHVVRVRHAMMDSAVSHRVRITSAAVTDLHVALPLPAVHESVTVTGIDVRSLRPEGVEGTPGAAGTLRAPDIRHYRPDSVHEALGWLPGVRTIDDDALGRRAGIGVRGSPPRRSRRVLLLEDGVPINAATYLDPSTHYTPPLERLDRIDVLKGAGQIVHGPLNNHGIVNFRTAQPTAAPATVVEGALGSRSTVRRHVMHTRTVGRAGIVLAYSGVNADGVFDSEAHQYDDAFGSVTWAISPRQEVGGSLTWFRERSHYDERNLTVAEFAAHPRSKLRLGEGAEFNLMAVNYVKGHVTHRLRPSDLVTITSHVFATDLDRPRFESRSGGPMNADGYMRGHERRYGTAGGAIRAEWTRPGPVRTTWEAGLRSERQWFDNRNTVGAVGEILGTGTRGRLVARDGVAYREDGRQETLEAWAVSGFVQSAVAIGRVTVTPGVRLERYSQSRTVDFRPGAVTPRRESDMRTLLLPGIGVRYPAGPLTDIHAGVHRGYSPAIARTEDFPLVPETGLDMQVGLRTRRLPGLTLDVAAFANRLENTLIKRTFTDAFGANIFVNSGGSHVRGVDIGARVDSQPITGSRLNAFLHLVYGLAEARFTEGPARGHRVPEVSRHFGRVSAGLEHAAGWSLSATVAHAGSFFTDEANTLALWAPDPDERLEIVGVVPGHTVLSARGSALVPGTRLTLWMQGRNLANRLYISDVQDGLRPGPGRTVSAGLRFAF